MSPVSAPRPSTRDTLGRRSRFARCATGKRIELGARDIAILQFLYRYRYLRQDHLLALVGPRSRKRFVERLGDLFHETGLISRPLLERPALVMRAEPMLYEISPAGIEWLRTRDALPKRAVTFSLRNPRGSAPQLAHRLMVVEALITIELATLRQPGQRFVPVDEILERAPAATRGAANPLRIALTIDPERSGGVLRRRLETHLIPDGLYGIEYRIEGESRYRFWALECERSTPAWRRDAAGSSTALKRAAYKSLIASGGFREHWGIPNLQLHLVGADTE